MSRKKTLNIVKNTAVAIVTILAWLSGYFVMQIVYDSIAASIVFGTLWAVIVFCESRFSYISLKSDGRISITKEELKINTWHIVAALILAVLVAIPLLLKAFEPDLLAYAADSAHNLKLQLQALCALYASHWIPMTAIALATVLVFQVPIFVKMASDE